MTHWPLAVVIAAPCASVHEGGLGLPRLGNLRRPKCFRLLQSSRYSPVRGRLIHARRLEVFGKRGILSCLRALLPAS